MILIVAIQLGSTSTACSHDPPRQFAQPNGAFPLTDGHYLITEILGDWVEEMSLNGQLYWSAHPPGVSYPSDANEVSPGRYIVADYSSPGQVVMFGRTGQLIWRFRPAGAAALNHPSLALPLPNGNILVNNEYNDRVIVISPRANRIVWQYGHNGVPGSAPGYLANPDGVDLAPPDIPESAWALMLGGAAEVIVTPNARHWSHSTSGANLSATDECDEGTYG